MDKTRSPSNSEEAMLIATLSFACSMFESMGVKHNEPHNKILTHLRNATLHNGGDIRKNTYKDSESECLTYLEAEPWKEFDPPEAEVHGDLFQLEDGLVTLGNGLLFFINRLFDSYLTEEERADPWGVKAKRGKKAQL